MEQKGVNEKSNLTTEAALLGTVDEYPGELHSDSFSAMHERQKHANNSLIPGARRQNRLAIP